MTVLIQWPAVISYFGDADMICVHSQQQWDTDDDLSGYDYHDSDCLIDSQGQLFRLSKRNATGKVIPVPEERLSVEQVMQHVREHLQQQGSCCVAKTGASSITEALSLVC